MRRLQAAFWTGYAPLDNALEREIQARGVFRKKRVRNVLSWSFSHPPSDSQLRRGHMYTLISVPAVRRGVLI